MTTLLSMEQPIQLVWFRRDLRWHDNLALASAQSFQEPILLLFIFDTNILSDCERGDARVQFIHQQITALDETAKVLGSSILVQHGSPEEVFHHLIRQYHITRIHHGEDFEPYAINRDTRIRMLAEECGIQVHTYVDHVLFHPSITIKSDGSPYRVYTPFYKNWILLLDQQPITENKIIPEQLSLVQMHAEVPSLSEIGFSKSELVISHIEELDKTIEHYKEQRDFPAVGGTSRLGIHLRFGTISIRSLVKKARSFKDDTFLKQLVWREFFISIMYHYPDSIYQSFKPKYRTMPWRYDDKQFDRWKNGMTGIPLVDAGMRQLNLTGWMHNRVRMITASWLTKNLLMDWKLGERYFALKLLDFELASNVGSWQWVAGTGCDAAPYFRIFNPFTQAKKFDPNNDYIKQWIPELSTSNYPSPMIDYKASRKRCLAFFKDHQQAV